MVADTKKKHKRYEEDYKRSAVRPLNDSGLPVTTIALQLGIEQSNLHKWSKLYGSYFKDRSVSGNLRKHRSKRSLP